MPSTVSQSPAKLNLFLEVSSRRADGFHELETVMVRTSFCDVIRVEASKASSTILQVRGDEHLVRNVPVDESNLILKAANAFRQAAGRQDHWTIHLEKRIPMEAGLAGGSSNAATTLRALNAVCGRPLLDDQLHLLASDMGSDINFFVADCEAAVCTGRGERVASFAVPAPFHFVVARPSLGNSTPAVFNRLHVSQRQRGSEDVVRALQAGSVSDLEAAVFNRLTTAACELNPKMQQLLSDMQKVCDRPAAMSGSGSTCFVCCHNEADAQATLQRVQSLQPDFAMVLSTQ